MTVNFGKGSDSIVLQCFHKNEQNFNFFHLIFNFFIFLKRCLHWKKQEPILSLFITRKEAKKTLSKIKIEHKESFVKILNKSSTMGKKYFWGMWVDIELQMNLYFQKHLPKNQSHSKLNIRGIGQTLAGAWNILNC